MQACTIETETLPMTTGRLQDRKPGCDFEPNRNSVCRTLLRIHGPCRHKLQYLLHTDGICSRVRFSFLKKKEVARARVLTATITETEAKRMILNETLAETTAQPTVLTKP